MTFTLFIVLVLFLLVLSFYLILKSKAEIAGFYLGLMDNNSEPSLLAITFSQAKQRLSTISDSGSLSFRPSTRFFVFLQQNKLKDPLWNLNAADAPCSRLWTELSEDLRTLYPFAIQHLGILSWSKSSLSATVFEIIWPIFPSWSLLLANTK